MKTAKDWIAALELLPHPEGGYYKEIYRSKEEVIGELLPLDRTGVRSVSTAIYYLLEKEDFSSFHRIKSDEIWHFYAGSRLIIYVIQEDGSLDKLILDENNPMQIVTKGLWFAAEIEDKSSYALVGCTVAPGFDFEDFEMADKAKLLDDYPDLKDVVEGMSRS